MKKRPSLIPYLSGLTITQGEGVGERMKLYPWERRFLKGLMATDGDAALSVSRGNGKTTLLAGVCASFIDGPLRQERAEVVLVASSFAQGRIGFDHTKAFLGEKIRDKATWRVADSEAAATIEHRPTGAKLRVIGCDPRRAHGLAPALILADEPSQWESTKSEKMVSALRTAQGKIPSSRFVAIGTRPESHSHWFEVMLKGGAGFAQSHHAGIDDDPFSPRTWHKANPSLRYMPHLRARIEAEAKEAKQDPSKLAAFRSLRLNMGTSDILRSHLIEAEEWLRIEGEVDRQGPYIMGVDLGTTAAMSAVAAYWPASGRLEALACFPELPTLGERGLSDGVGRLYIQMFERDELIIRGRRVSDIGGLLAEARARWGYPIALASDRWREGELRDCLEDAGFPIARLETRGMGYRDGGEDCRDFRSACLGGRVTPTKSLLLTSAMSEARTICDPAGNQKLSKGVEGGRRLNARDDAAAAGILAVACGVRLWRNEQPKERGVYLGKV